jgi:putative aminopeptidase FrvX
LRDTKDQPEILKKKNMDFKLLEELISVRGVSGDESEIKDFILNYVKNNEGKFNHKPVILYGEEFQDNLILIFGEPRTAIFAHMDTIGFTVGYDKDLIKIGGPKASDNYSLVGKDTKGEIDAELMVIENDTGNLNLQYVFNREIDRGTLLSFKPNFRQNETYIQSPYLDNRLGVWTALKVAENLENGAIVFSTYEEHGGNTVGFLSRFLSEQYGIRQALISDITWVTNGVKHGGGVAISMRDQYIPRRKYLNRIIEIAKKSDIDYQLEVESAGGSDGGYLQKADTLFDWCFIGAPEDNVHSPDEKVYIKDIVSMIDIYRLLMKEL